MCKNYILYFVVIEAYFDLWTCSAFKPLNGSPDMLVYKDWIFKILYISTNINVPSCSSDLIFFWTFNYF